MDGGNLVLIGMPSAGKSTVGVLAAKEFGMDFLDTDILVQARQGKRLQALIDQDGLAAFLHMEEAAILSLHAGNTVIATGGSVVYSSAAMAHLRRLGTVVWLEVDLGEIKRRLGDAAARGIAMRPGQTLSELYLERNLLYAAYADGTIHWTEGKAMEDMVVQLRPFLPERMNPLG